MGHARVYFISDVISRFETSQLKTVLHPMGWDAFGLPAENAALSRNVSPSQWTISNIKEMKFQMQKLGVLFNWDKELSTCHPSYYKWTQQLFLSLLNHGLAYKAQAEVNWDPVDQTVLANEQVDVNGRSWRSGAKVERKKLSQWFVRTTSMARELVEDLDKLDKWPKEVKEMQKGWIGLKNGVGIIFLLEKEGKIEGEVEIFTTRIETLFGVSFIGVSKEHKLAQLKEEGKLEKLKAIHPLTGEKLPVFVCEYVLNELGTGAIMGVPAHDERDKKFAEKFGIKCLEVLEGENLLKNSGRFSGLKWKEGGEEMIKELGKRARRMEVSLMRDWLVSRQR